MSSYKYQESSTLLQHIDSLEGVDTHGVLIEFESITSVLGDSAKVLYTSHGEELANQSNQPATTGLSEHIFSISISFILVLFYAYFVSYHKKSILVVLKSATYSDSAHRIEAISDKNIEKAIRDSAYMFPVVVAYGCTILANSFLSDTYDYNIIIVFTLVLTMLVLLSIYKLVLTNSIAYISSNKSLQIQIKLGSQIAKFVSITILFPITMLLSFTDISSSYILMGILLIIITFLTINSILTLFNIFRRENISFLEYILYLCTLEFIPISFLYVYSSRYLMH